MYHQTTAWAPRPAAQGAPVAARSSDTVNLPGLVAKGLLAVASCVLLALAVASAWLSYHAQVAYVLEHNGDQYEQARVWALLLDIGTAGVSLLRLHETLRTRPSLGTKASLLGCVGASVTMNLLHAPSRTPGGYLVAVVPPLMYAVFLEHLLANLRTLLTAQDKRRSMWRTLTLWLNFPAVMWSVRRGALRRVVQDDLVAPDSGCASDLLPSQAGEDEQEAVQRSDRAKGAQVAGTADGARRGRRPGAKRVAFEAALAEQLRCGDRRLFSDDQRTRNAAAYQAAASLPVPLSRGAARRYVVQALPRLADVGRAVPRPLPAAVTHGG